MSDFAYRYAVYLIPVGPWARLGARWLGRDALTGTDVRRMPPVAANVAWQSAVAKPATTIGDLHQDLDPIDIAQIDAWTHAPRHYGLHGTLKPPFRMAEGETPYGLDMALRQLARAHRPFAIPLALQSGRGYLAWSLAAQATSLTHAGARALHDLADDCVASLDRFRMPASEQEISRRRGAGLSPEQDAHLVRWGYPYVFDTFIFHITLTNCLDDLAMAQARLALDQLAVADDREALRCGAIMPVAEMGLFVQMTPDQPFVAARRYGFDGMTHDESGASALGGNTP